MLYTVKEDLELCKQFKLSPMQLMFLKILVNDPNKTEGDQVKDAKQLSLKFQTVFAKTPITPDELADLIARDFIIDYNEDGQLYFDLYELSGKWKNKLRLAVYPMPQQLWDKYPINLNISGKMVVAKNASPEDIAMPYLRNINKSPEEHQKVLEDIEWAIDNNEINIGLKKFVDSKYWLHIRAIKDSKVDKGTFNNINIL